MFVGLAFDSRGFDWTLKLANTAIFRVATGGAAFSASPRAGAPWRIRSALRFFIDKRYACGEPPTDERPWPLGFRLIGCRLMLVQLPIWFALFRLLRSFIVRCHIQIVRREGATPPVTTLDVAVFASVGSSRTPWSQNQTDTKQTTGIIPSPRESDATASLASCSCLP